MVDYIDLAFFQNYTRTTFDGTTDPTDAQVQILIDMGNQEVEDLTGRTWNRTNDEVEYVESPTSRILLSNTPVLNITSVVDADGNDVSYTQVNRDLIELDKLVPVTITYDHGYDNVPIAIKKLATLYTLQMSVQGGSASSDNTESISVGPISIASKVGLSTVVNLDSDVKKYEKKVRRLIT